MPVPVHKRIVITKTNRLRENVENELYKECDNKDNEQKDRTTKSKIRRTERAFVPATREGANKAKRRRRRIMVDDQRIIKGKEKDSNLKKEKKTVVCCFCCFGFSRFEFMSLRKCLCFVVDLVKKKRTISVSLLV